MDFDVEQHLGAVDRSVASDRREGIPVRAVILARSFETGLDDLWDAVTSGARLSRWFAPVSGDLGLGGRFQIAGNAEGTIQRCDPLSALSLTWEFGGEASWVELRLETQEDGRSRLTLSHIAPVSEHWTTYGPGAAGVGWELGLAGLARHLADPEADPLDEAAFAASPEGRMFLSRSSQGWAVADVNAGEDPERAHAAARATAAFYTGDASAEGAG